MYLYRICTIVLAALATLLASASAHAVIILGALVAVIGLIALLLNVD